MISIVMPAHNEQGYLEPAVKAVVAAGRDRNVPFEVVIAENGSSDDHRRRGAKAWPRLSRRSGC